MKTKRVFAAGLCAVLFFTLGSVAFADDGVTKFRSDDFTEAAQRSSSVCLVVDHRQNFGSNDEWVDIDAMELTRGDEVLIPEGSFDEKYVADAVTKCFEVEGRDCENEPEQCADCDHDGDRECPGYCKGVFRVLVSDLCPEAGNHKYQLTLEWGKDPAWVYRYRATINIAAPGEPCADTEEVCADLAQIPYGLDDDDDDTGCGGCASGPGSTAFPLTAVMLAVGMIAWWAARKK